MFFNFDPDSPSSMDNVRGVGIYVSNSLHASEVHFYDSTYVEHVWVSIQLRGSDFLTVGCIYRSPSFSTDLTTNDLCELLSAVPRSSHCLVCGDFNYGNIDWENHCQLTPANIHVQHFLDILNDLFWTQHVTEPTRYRPGQSPHILDLAFTNEAGMINNMSYLPGLGCSDHICLSFNLTCYVDYRATIREKYNLYLADFDRMRQILGSYDWNEALDQLDTDEAWDYFYNVFNNLIQECVPSSRPKNRRNNIYITREVMRLKNTKNRLWRQYSSTRDPLDYAAFTSTRNALRSLTRKLRKTFEESITKNLKTNPKAFWKYSKSRLKTHPTINGLISSDGNIVHCDASKVEIFNNFFTSVFTNENISSLPAFNLDMAVPALSDIVITPDRVLEKLKLIQTCKSPGPDGWPPRVIKECADMICIPLAKIYSKSLSTGSLPKDWKIAHIVPIFQLSTYQLDLYNR